MSALKNWRDDMKQEWIWVHKKDKRVKGAVGFVTCDKAIADALLAEGKAQLPSVGAIHLAAE
jgi:hypothetical protein